MYMLIEIENKYQLKKKKGYITIDRDTKETRKWYDWNYEVTKRTPDFATVEDALKHIEDNNLVNMDLLISHLQRRGWKSEGELLTLKDHLALKTRDKKVIKSFLERQEDESKKLRSYLIPLTRFSRPGFWELTLFLAEENTGYSLGRWWRDLETGEFQLSIFDVPDVPAVVATNHLIAVTCRRKLEFDYEY